MDDLGSPPPTDLRMLAEDTRKRYGKRPSEIPAQRFWAERYHFLMKRGYRLHEKFAPDWIPPWELNPRTHPLDYTESIPVVGFNFGAASSLL